MNKQELLDFSAGEVVLVDDNASLLANVSDYLSLHFGRVHTLERGEDAIELVAKAGDFFKGVVVCDVRMPSVSGFDVLDALQGIDRDLPVVLVTAYGDVTQAVKAIHSGAYDFIEKPFEPERLLKIVRQALEKRFLTFGHHALRAQLAEKDAIENRLIGVSPGMVRLRREILNLARLDVPVLINGETGAGKELVASCLHEYSDRKQYNFVPLNCAAIPESLFESELFGHVEGAFSGAGSVRVGKLVHADQGTLFLDEAESIPLAAQVKLLRILSEKKVEALGTNDAKEIDIRVIAATKQELRDHPDFRQDLYFRLQVAELYIPPLRERPEDVLVLFEHYARAFTRREGIEWNGASPVLQKQLRSYHWPGNVRELINVATRCSIRRARSLSEIQRDAKPAPEPEPRTLKDRVEQYEMSILKEALERHRGKVTPVLEELGIERRTFNLKLKKYGLQREAFLGEFNR